MALCELFFSKKIHFCFFKSLNLIIICGAQKTVAPREFPFIQSIHLCHDLMLRRQVDMERQQWLRGTLYSPAFEQDSCGFGLIAQLDDQPSHWLVSTAISSLAQLTHR
ncbi:MAG: hypothetical protein KBE71_07245, partial [Laribacter sp.]|nr:hypothetical protein [Laribacter sp.]